MTRALKGSDRPPWRLSRIGAALAVGGVALCVAGFVGGFSQQGEAVRGWGFLTGIGFAVLFAGVVRVWIDREIDVAAVAPGGARKRERLQAQRASQLWLFPVATVVLLGMALAPAGRMLEGRADLRDLWWLLLPVLYGWVITAITLGWDAHSRNNRRFLDDELTRALRARAIKAGFIVLMLGTTAALILGLIRAELSVVAMPFVLALGGAAAGIRFAWLDREVGKGG